VMTVHKLSAGDGYSYLTRQVASADEPRPAGQSLAEYYVARGTRRPTSARSKSAPPRELLAFRSPPRYTAMYTECRRTPNTAATCSVVNPADSTGQP
jgi:hypothetical protein